MSDIPPEGNIKRRSRRSPTSRIENEYDPEIVPQYFQVTVNVLEAKNLSWAHPQNPTSHVVVSLGKKRRKSNWRKNMEEPYYREYFVFELYTSLRDIQRKSVRLAVMESRRCGPSRLIGEANIDLSAIWEQPYHQVYHKWAQLLHPKDLAVGAVGYLKVDISILLRGEPQHIPEVVHNTNIEENLLLPSGSVQQRANFVVTIYNGYALPSGWRCYGDRRYGKAPDTFVKVTFAGLTAKTVVQNRNSNPAYNEQVSMVEMFPNMSQDVQIEVCSGDGPIKKVICGTRLRLSEISNDGESGFLPTFGPSLLLMYGTSSNPAAHTTAKDGPYYKGALLVALNTQVPYYLQGLRTAKTKSVAPLHPDSIWSLENICIYCPVFEVSMIDKKIVGNSCAVAITMGEIPIDKKYDTVEQDVNVIRDGKGSLLKDESEALKRWQEYFESVFECQESADTTYDSNIDCKSENVSDIDMDEILKSIKGSKKLYHTGELEVKRTHSPYGHLEFPYAFPVLELATRLPDFRFRMFRNNMVYGIFLALESAVVEVERRLKTFEYKMIFELISELDTALEDTAGNIMNFFQIVQKSNQDSDSNENVIDKYATELDKKQMKLQKQELENIFQSLTSATKSSTDTSVANSKTSRRELEKEVDSAGDAFSRKTVKRRLIEAYDLLDKLKSLVFKSFEGWPDIVIWLLNNGSRIAYTKVFVGNIIYSSVREQRGQDCGKIQSVFLKPLVCPKHMTTQSTGCFCIAAKVELLLWMGTYDERSYFPQELPDGYRVKTKEVDMCVKANGMTIVCRAFVYRGKLNGGLDVSGLADPFIRINIFNASAETETKWKTLTPVWNQVLKIRAKVFTSNERLNSYSPIVIVEVYDRDEGDSIELMGRSQIEPVMENRTDYMYAPKLQWHDIFKGIEFTGQILMSVQLLQVASEEELRTIMYDTMDDLDNSNKDKSKKSASGYVEELPEHLIPVNTTYKLDVYWWGLRDMTITRKPCAVLEMDELIIKSQAITEKKSCSNFVDGKVSEIFEAPLDELYCPPLSIRLYDSGTFGRTVFVGTNVIKNPNKYLIRWLPQEQREASIRSSSLSLQICQVSERFQSNNPICATTDRTQNKILPYDDLFARPEEERTLLPLFTRKEKRTYEAVNVRGTPETSKDWWLRFFCSQSVCTPEEKVSETDFITIYKSELENQPQFSKFKDWCATFKLYHGKKTGIPDKDAQLFSGFLKAGIALYKWPPPTNTIAVSPSGVDLCKGECKIVDDIFFPFYRNLGGLSLLKGIPANIEVMTYLFSNDTISVRLQNETMKPIKLQSGYKVFGEFFSDHPSNEPSKFLVRVYVIKGYNLMAKDFTGKSDPYLILKCGKKTLGERKNYIPNTLNPVFGRVYEFQSSFPDDYLLTVFVYDYDIVPPDDLIGCTSIDLEDRVYTKHRATCGLSTDYSLTGPNRWRDCMKPSAILKELCLKNYVPGPTFPDDSTVVVDGVTYSHSNYSSFASASDLRENICLNILHKWHTLPICGYHLVPEHIETRTLYNQEKAGLEQGKLQMWIDIFPLNTGMVIPPPVDVTPQKVVEYELRMIVWDTEGIKLDDYNIISGQRSSDIYVKAWIGDYEQAQQTDIHYRSLTGVGNFNWRMVFHFFYQHAERKMILKSTGMFSNQEEHIPPVLVVQVMDSDAITADDFLGSLTLNLNSMPRGAKMARQADISLLKKMKKVNLFSVNSIRGWWPLKILDRKTGIDMPAGVIDLELTLLPKEKAVFMPVGLGREGPHPLPLPKRPETSFNIYTNPLLTLKSVLKSKGYKYLFIATFIALSFMLLLSAITNVPRILLEKWLKGNS